MRARKRAERGLTFLKFFLCLLGVVLFDYYASQPITDRLFLLRGKAMTTSQRISDYFRDFKTIEKENHFLRDANIKLVQQMAEYQYFRAHYEATLEENRQIKKLLGLKETLQTPLFTRPIRVYSEPNNHSVRANLPSAPIQIGMAVLNEDGLMVGRVASLTQSTLLVHFLNDKRSALPVSVSDRHINAIAIGNGLDIDLMHLPLDSGIQAGDVVKTPSSATGRALYWSRYLCPRQSR